MQRIGLTQRVEVIQGPTGPAERRDALDQRWHGLFAELGALAVPLPNGGVPAAALIDELGLNAIVLTGGNNVAEAPHGVSGAANVAPERDRLERDMIATCRTRGVPLLGVCRGMQMINVALGGHLERTSGHAGVRHAVSLSGNDHWPENWDVNSYHDVSIPLASLAPSLRCLARADSGDVEAFVHLDDSCHGIMWHPEREAPFRAEDLAYLKQVLEL
ncbi:MAG: C26 family cysteine hydrolase domain-containing family [Rhodospirillaceae bacterium]|jgi:putative glutamine amidotransferase|nr:C26 family cysteine hydrolase domain-containing family [Rhodospirillaceae bacterium]MBT3491622.1 C26 family cysteine hydrolase domain-containing family [Rhodospirillaceae bacterium]MBT3781024.1 C26 family cysteine hydrolase domain-containing family [Rhodospirillaceae bacterium]MBT3976160.1 C26 family cysteine hydrolase domain-containing family [Rhodospirillaceae bacterium]MBT4168170.1 C26 family cysteine hydrolase domain-containing family [Rhodospirillaceae bacterium]